VKFTSAASIGILEYALKREQESRDFYKECLEKATIGGTQEILKGLVSDEERHYAIVNDMLAEAKKSGGIKNVDTSDAGDGKKQFGKAFPHTMVKDADFSAESASVGEMLKKALDNEQESYNNYSKAAEEADEPELREIYGFLAKEENRHYNLIDNLIDYLADPDEWIYEEENLVFRRG